ncbi:hypothetical protein BJ508DRAFT_169882 [Ascobolus immersus RN42]|uniref:Uncharacterized protein n=1 Tax=Ascobolus immersus RN42 TaxID=1160509 RepID=A0A3N4HUN7_ASCIM|nr:hypothetical protein BJ508DRAFT_169882 [Ascobolus immersus RN42]
MGRSRNIPSELRERSPRSYTNPRPCGALKDVHRSPLDPSKEAHLLQQEQTSTDRFCIHNLAEGWAREPNSRSGRLDKAPQATSTGERRNAGESAVCDHARDFKGLDTSPQSPSHSKRNQYLLILQPSSPLLRVPFLPRRLRSRNCMLEEDIAGIHAT